MADLNIIGKDVQRIDVREKATGKAKYALDLTFPGMLTGKVLRSPYPHAKIINMDVSKSERLKGVEAILYRDNASKVLWGDFLTDQTVVATEKVRFIGDPVAAVAASDTDTAEEADFTVLRNKHCLTVVCYKHADCIFTFCRRKREINLLE